MADRPARRSGRVATKDRPEELQTKGGGGGGRGFWTQNLVYQKWPDQIFPIVNFVFSRDGHFGLGRGGGAQADRWWLVSCIDPPPLLHSNRLRATVSARPKGNIPQMTVPLPPPPPPPITMQRRRDSKQVMQTRGHMNHKMSRELPVGMRVQLYSETGSVCHCFWREYLTLKSCTCSTRATDMGSPAAGWAAGLAATWAEGLAALLREPLLPLVLGVGHQIQVKSCASLFVPAGVCGVCLLSGLATISQQS